MFSKKIIACKSSGFVLGLSMGYTLGFDNECKPQKSSVQSGIDTNY
jgi:hypothetical protein